MLIQVTCEIAKVGQMTSSSLGLPAQARHQRPTPSSSCAQPPQTLESEFGGGLRQTFASLLFCSTCCKAYVTNVSDPLKLLKTVTLGRDQSVLLHSSADDQEKVSPLVSLRSNHLQFSAVLCKNLRLSGRTIVRLSVRRWFVKAVKQEAVITWF